MVQSYVVFLGYHYFRNNLFYLFFCFSYHFVGFFHFSVNRLAFINNIVL